MDRESSPHYEDEVLVVSPDQVRIANELTDKVVAEFIDNRYDWPSSNADASFVQRMTTSDGTVAIVVTRTHAENNSMRVQFIRYILAVDTRRFTVIPELHDFNNEPSSDRDTSLDSEDVSGGVDEALFHIGFNQANLQDWSDFIDILIDGQEYLQKLRALEAKLGIAFGKVATRGKRKDNPPVQG